MLWIHYEISFCCFPLTTIWMTACMRGICLPVEFYARVRFVSVAWAVHHEPFARLLICWHFSMLHFPTRTETIFDDIQTYSVLDFPSLDGIPTYSVSEICNVSVILEVSDKLSCDLLWNHRRSCRDKFIRGRNSRSTTFELDWIPTEVRSRARFQQPLYAIFQ